MRFSPSPLPRYAAIAGAAIAFASLGGCGLILSYADYTAGAGGSGTGSSSEATTGSSTSGGGGHGGAAATASVSASSSGGGASAAAGTGGGSPCAQEETCFVPPAGWSGPFTYDPIGKGCSAGWHTQQTGTAFDLACVCACGIDSPACTATVGLFSDSMCTMGLKSFANFTKCTAPGQPAAANYVQWSDVPAVPPACPPKGAATPSQAPGTVCAPNAAPACDDGTCVPAKTNLCVTHTGDVDCPLGFSAQHVMGGLGSADLRTCSASQCACVQPTGFCNAQLELWAMNAACSGPAQQTLTDGSCSKLDLGVVESLDVVDNPVFSCTATGTSKPMGQVTGPNVITACCTQ
jgi:hypothetical protein